MFFLLKKNLNIDDRTAKISRPGFTSENSKMTLGKVADLVTGQIPEELNFDRLNTMALMQDNEDFFCSLYYEPSKVCSTKLLSPVDSKLSPSHPPLLLPCRPASLDQPATVLSK
jgi:hypothetical protein